MLPQKWQQMYKIYINGTPLYLVSSEEVKSFDTTSEKKIVLRHAGKKKFLVNIVHQLETSDRFDAIVVFDTDVERIWSDFQKIYKPISAAGGAVFNADGKVLLIHRRGSWDLPKGKRVALIVDPFEEIFRYRRESLKRDGGNETELFVKLLLNVIEQGDCGGNVLLTMRSVARTA